MRRRSFLGGLSAAIAGLFGCGRAAPGEVDRVVSLEEAIREAKKDAWKPLESWEDFSPLDREMIRESRECFARGEYEDVRELLRRAKAGEPL